MEKLFDKKTFRKWTKDDDGCHSWVPITYDTVRAFAYIDEYSKEEVFDFYAECPSCNEPVYINPKILPDEIKEHAIKLVRKKYEREGKSFPILDDVYKGMDFTRLRDNWKLFRERPELLKRKKEMLIDKMQKLAKCLEDYNNGGKEKISALDIEETNVNIPFNLNEAIASGKLVMQNGKTLTAEQEAKLRKYYSIGLTVKNLQCAIYEEGEDEKNVKIAEFFIEHPEYGFRLQIDEDCLDETLKQYIIEKTFENLQNNPEYMKIRNWHGKVPVVEDDYKILLNFDADTMEQDQYFKNWNKAYKKANNTNDVDVSTMTLAVKRSIDENNNKTYYFSIYNYDDRVMYYLDPNYIPDDVKAYAIKRFELICAKLDKMIKSYPRKHTNNT